MSKLRRYVYLAIFALSGPMFAYAGPVNVNTADAETISAELKGVGLAKAQAIVAYRKQNGPFKSRAELTAVKGIGARTVEINRDNILLDGSTDRTKK